MCRQSSAVLQVHPLQLPPNSVWQLLLTPPTRPSAPLCCPHSFNWLIFWQRAEQIGESGPIKHTHQHPEQPPSPNFMRVAVCLCSVIEEVLSARGAGVDTEKVLLHPPSTRMLCRERRTCVFSITFLIYSKQQPFFSSAAHPDSLIMHFSLSNHLHVCMCMNAYTRTKVRNQSPSVFTV